MEQNSFLYIKTRIEFKGSKLGFIEWDIDSPISIRTKGTKYEQEEYKIWMEELDGNNVNYVTEGVFKIAISKKKYECFLDTFKSEGKICIQTLDNKLKSFLIDDKNYESTFERTRSLFKKFRWRFKLVLRSNVEVLNNRFVSADMEKWFPIIDCPAPTNLRAYASWVPEDKTLIYNISSDFLTSDFEEPLYHDLIREAKLILYPNYKSAFAIAVAAFESATKEFLARKIARARNLIYKTPSPDLYKIYSEIIPELEPKFLFDSDSLASIRNILTIRNELLHRGETNLSISKATEYVHFIYDVICLIDYFTGFLWSDINLAKARLKSIDNSFVMMP